MKRALEAFIQYLSVAGVRGVVGIHVNRRTWSMLITEVEATALDVGVKLKQQMVEQLEMATPFGITLIVEPLEVKIEPVPQTGSQAEDDPPPGGP